MTKKLASKENVVRNEKLTEHFKSHFGKRQCEKQPEVVHPEQHPFLLPNIHERIDESPPREVEIRNAIKTLKNNKCMGTDKIKNEQLKYSTSNALIQTLTAMMCMIWSMVIFPASWLHSTICCLYKNKGKASDAKNYRGLSINATLNKILMSVVLDRIRDVYESNILENQFGFRKNRSTNDAIFIVKNIIAKTDGFWITCFVDLRAAYDHIDREMLFDVLGIRLGSTMIVKLLRELYSNTSATIQASKESFQTFVGCRQGAKESPCLFNIYLDFVLRICDNEVCKRFPDSGIKYKYNYPPECTTREMRSKSPASGTDHLRMLLYADDIMVLCRDIEELEAIMNIYNGVFKRFGLTIADDKTKTMVFNTNEDVASTESLIKINNTPLENVRKFRYLGHTISNIDDKEHLNTQIGAAYQKYTEMKGVFTDKEIAMPIRVSLLETYVRSRLLYSVQTRRLKAREVARLNSIWMNFLRRIVRGGFNRQHIYVEGEIEEENWAYKYSNNDIFRITKSQPISNFCDQQHLKFLAHVVRSDNACLPKRMLFMLPTRRYVHDLWGQLEKDTNVDKVNLRRTMMNKDEFRKWIATSSVRGDSLQGQQR